MKTSWIPLALFLMSFPCSAHAEEENTPSNAHLANLRHISQSKILIEDKAIASYTCGQAPCEASLDQLSSAIQSHYREETCKNPFKLNTAEIDCGTDGTPDILLTYEGLCIAENHADERSGLVIPVQMQQNGNPVIRDARDYWEQSTFVWVRDTQFSEETTCGYHCTTQGAGSLDSSCRFVYDYTISCSNPALFHDKTGGISISDVVIKNKTYHSLCAAFIDDISELYYLGVLKRYAERMQRYLSPVMHFKQPLEDQFRTNAEITSLIETNEP